MGKWEEKRLSSICKVISGYAFKSEDFQENGIPVIKISNIGNKFCDLKNNLQYVDEYFLQNLDKKYIIEKDSILISLTGSHITQPNSMVGRSCRYSGEDAILLNQRAGRIIPKQGSQQGIFLYYIMQSQWIKEYIGLVAYGAANQANISPKTIENIKVKLPDLPTQKRIADILSAYDDLIENNNRRIELLEKAAQELYKEWFVRFRFPNQSKFVNGLPEGWGFSKIGLLFDTSSGGTPSRSNPQYYIDGKYDWIKTGELSDRFILETEERITDEAIHGSSAKIVPKNSLILAMYGATIGKMGFTTKESTCNQACCVFSPKTKLKSTFLFFWLLDNRDYIINIGFGAAQQNLSQDLIKKIKMLKPNDNIVGEFEEKVQPFFDNIKLIMQQTQNLKRQRDLLLPRLMSGKLEV